MGKKGKGKIAYNASTGAAFVASGETLEEPTMEVIEQMRKLHVEGTAPPEKEQGKEERPVEEASLPAETIAEQGAIWEAISPPGAEKSVSKPPEKKILAFVQEEEEPVHMPVGPSSSRAKRKQKGAAKHEGPEAPIEGTLEEPSAAPSAASKSKEKGKKKQEIPPMIEKVAPMTYRISEQYVPHMNVPGYFYVNDALAQLVFEELHSGSLGGGFLPAPKQIANVASLPGILKASVGLPDMHSGYGFAIGNVAAFDMDDPQAVVSPGGVGFDINCGVRVIRTNLMEQEVAPKREQLAEALYNAVPVGVGSTGSLYVSRKELDELLERGLEWAVQEGFAWKEDLEHCEENGRMKTADASAVSERAKKRGIQQVGTLGAGNHYAEVQVVDEIYDQHAADVMGLGKKGQVCVMLHSGSRGLGHQVATDALTQMETAMARDKIQINDRQLACALIGSREGQLYLKAMSAAANFAWVNRAHMTHHVRQVFEQQFGRSARDLDMHLVYDVCHNIAKIEDHVVDGVRKRTLVHRKGATRAFPPHHPMVPQAYQEIGQPVLIGGSMGTFSYILVGTDGAMEHTFGSTCHGAGRAQSRHKARGDSDWRAILDTLESQGISIRVQTKKLIGEEAPEAYKNVSDVVDTCDAVGISKKVIKLRPIAVIKG